MKYRDIAEASVSPSGKKSRDPANVNRQDRQVEICVSVHLGVQIIAAQANLRLLSRFHHHSAGEMHTDITQMLSLLTLTLHHVDANPGLPR